jgi:hypothetical protein
MTSTNKSQVIMAGVMQQGCPASIETFQKQQQQQQQEGGDQKKYVKIGHVELEPATNVSCFVTVQDDVA